MERARGGNGKIITVTVHFPVCFADVTWRKRPAAAVVTANDAANRADAMAYDQRAPYGRIKNGNPRKTAVVPPKVPVLAIAAAVPAPKAAVCASAEV